MPIDDASMSDIVAIFQTEIDGLLHSLGKPITMYFHQQVTNVNNEFYDPVRGRETKEPSYKASNSSSAPVVTETTKTINALIRNNPTDYQRFGLKINENNGIVRLKTYLSDVPDLKRCDYIVINTKELDIAEAKYRLAREPIPTGLQQNRYAISYWERI
jgi:hypothetical protein